MIATSIIFIITYFFIATEKINKAIAALLGVSTVFVFHLAPWEKTMEKVDFNVLILLASMMAIVNILSETGIFEWIAIKIAQAANGNVIIISLSFFVVTAFLSAFLDNVTTIILIAPITILITQILDVPAVPLLVLEAIFSNIGGTATLIGDPPNIIIGSKANLHFIDFVKALSLPIIVIIAVSSFLAYFIIRKNAKTSQTARMILLNAKPEKAILDPKKLKITLVIFFLTLLGFFLSHLIHLKPGIIALIGASMMAIFTKTDIEKMFEKIEWTTIIFFAGLFMLIGAMEYNGVFEAVGEKIINLTNGKLFLTCMVILWFGAFLSAIVDNIPLVIALIPLIQSIIPEFSKTMGITSPELIKTQIAMPLYWSLALGSCLGGNGSLIGASANVVVSQIAKANRYEMTFWDFTKTSIVFMLVSIVISSFYIYFAYFF